MINVIRQQNGRKCLKNELFKFNPSRKNNIHSGVFKNKESLKDNFNIFFWYIHLGNKNGTLNVTCFTCYYLYLFKFGILILIKFQINKLFELK
ncbi:hypothetical protein BpHYR1_050808 [Brachionus plicatilis]|uniref:Uncharacterized protein n=1 Tax=Brachionus plicatilis TaxID=10195 RepID=A0A3M7T7R2_BRAPC|nr:hypothetical protein BpHYR1_050808 [Brachionus plicatilis]